MGWRTVADVRDFSEATGSAYIVLVMLAERAPDETRCAHPGIDLLAKDARISRSTCVRALNELEAMGEIRALAYRKGGRGKATDWFIAAGVESKQAQDDMVSEGRKRVSSGGKTVSFEAQNHVTGDTPTKEPNRTERKKPSASKAENPPDEAAIKFCRFLEEEAGIEPRSSYPPTQLEAARWLLDHATREDLRDAIAFAHTKPFYATKVLTAGKVKQHWKELLVAMRAERKGAQSRGQARPNASHQRVSEMVKRSRDRRAA
jgi:hypothetical protein